MIQQKSLNNHFSDLHSCHYWGLKDWMVFATRCICLKNPVIQALNSFSYIHPNWIELKILKLWFNWFPNWTRQFFLVDPNLVPYRLPRLMRWSWDTLNKVTATFDTRLLLGRWYAHNESFSVNLSHRLLQLWYLLLWLHLDWYFLSIYILNLYLLFFTTIFS